MQLNIEFQEEYKRLDRLCRDCLGSTEGVSEYIRQMDSASWEGQQSVDLWKTDYKSLKHVRWIRNQLAHEVGTLTSNICEQSDLDFVKSFYQRILDSTDSLSLLRKARASRTANRRIETVADRTSNSRNDTVANRIADEARPKSLLSRIAEKFKRWFFGE